MSTELSPLPSPEPGSLPLLAPVQPTERDKLERRKGIREVVFGVQDGLLTTMGLTTGVATAAGAAAVAHTTILIAGLAGALAGMVSMGTGAYLAGTAERDLNRNAIKLERAELASQPEEEHQEMVQILGDRGVPADDAAELARLISRYPRLWEETHIEKELGISVDPTDTSVRDGLTMSGTFLLGAILPIAPYIFLNHLPAVLWSLGLSAVGLIVVGVVKARVTGQSAVIGGAQVLLVGGAAALAGYLLGVILPHAFGLTLPAS